MGIDKHGLLLLEYAARKGVNFDAVCTIGRQQVQIDKAYYKKLLNEIGNTDRIGFLDKVSGEIYQTFYENFFKELFKSKITDSIDASGYEGASIVHDLNLPLPDRSKGKYSLVIDYGSSEHIFNVAGAFDNIINLCREGGTILHIVPSNQWSGHGFYQFSPQLFFSMYSPDRGFDKTEVFVSEKVKPCEWYRVTNPIELKRRVCFESKGEVYVIVKTTKVKMNESMLSKNPIQQSDWLVAWAGNVQEIDCNNSLKNKLKSYISKNHKILYLIIKTILRNAHLIIQRLKKFELITNHKDLIRENMIIKLKSL